jgi:hypothetical protein
VRFQQRHIDAAASQQESQHHSARSASYDATRSLPHFMRVLNGGAHGKRTLARIVVKAVPAKRNPMTVIF